MKQRRGAFVHFLCTLLIGAVGAGCPYRSFSLKGGEVMTLEEARDILRVDEGANDDLISGLVEAIPGYIEVATGMTLEQQEEEPMVKTVGGFLLRLWYFADHADEVKLGRTIDNLLKCITCKVKTEEVAEVAGDGGA